MSEGVARGQRGSPPANKDAGERRRGDTVAQSCRRNNQTHTRRLGNVMSVTPGMERGGVNRVL